MNKKLYIALAAVIVLIAVVLIVTATQNAGQDKVSAYIGQPVPPSVLANLAIPNPISNKIGIGGVQYFPQKISSPAPLVNGTKPEILYIGAEYCPYCAVTRWGMIIALMRFGTFTNLHYMASNGTDVFPDTPTFDFANSTYTSNYVSFVAVETTTRNRLVNLQTPTPFEQSIFDNYNSEGGIPFIDFGNQSVQLSAPVLPTTLEGQTWNSTIANLTNSNSSIAQALIGSGNMFTAQICLLTNETPQDVCSQPYVTNIQRNDLS